MVPTEIKLRRKSRILQVSFDDATFELPCEYLRVYSPSAEVRGHGADEGILVSGKRAVNIERIEPVGSYAVRLCFDDGHNTGLYTWQGLRELGAGYAQNWQDYLQRLQAAGATRE